MAKILGLPFDSYVDKQVNIRQTKLARTQKEPEDLVVFNSNTAWVRLTSGVKIEPDKAKTLSTKLGVTEGQITGTKLARSLVLFGGVASYTETGEFNKFPGGVGYGLNNAYGFLTTSDQGLKPPPGITNITTAYKNNGSLRQAQVSIKCYSRSQFEALEAVYLRLGYTVILEWGNSVWYNNEGVIEQAKIHTIPNLLFKNEENVDPDTVRSSLQTNKEKYSCNYDGMMAKVSNFSWNLNEDLSFDIKLDLVSVGDIIDSLKANLGGSAGAVSVQIETSGSIQNIVNIVVNKEVSKVNKLFYEMYDEVFKDLLQKFGSLETQKAIQNADNIEKTAGFVGEIQAKYNTQLFDKLYEPYNLYKQATAVWEEVKKSYAKFIADTRITNLAQRFDYSDNNDLFNNLIAQSTDNEESANNYKAKVDTLKAYFDNLKPAGTSEGTSRLEYLQNSKDTLGDLVRALSTGYFDVDKKHKLEDVQYTDSGFNSGFSNALEDQFFKQYNFSV